MKPEMEHESKIELEDAAVESAEATADTAQNAGTTGAELSAVEQEIESLRQTAEENYQRYLRTQADFDNFRKRSRQEKEESIKYASQKLIEGLLPIMDNFERAISASQEQKDFESLAKGVDMIYRQIGQLLEGEGLQAIEALGQPFNPEYHMAVMQAEAQNGEESGMVVEEMQKGYMLKDRVIRPSMVKVSQ